MGADKIKEAPPNYKEEDADGADDEQSSSFRGPALMNMKSFLEIKAKWRNLMSLGSILLLRKHPHRHHQHHGRIKCTP